MASAGFLQLVVTTAFGSPYSPSAKPPRVGTRTFLPCNRHMILSISLPTAKRVVVSHHLELLPMPGTLRQKPGSYLTYSRVS